MRISDPFVGPQHEPIGLGLLPDSMVISPPSTTSAAATSTCAMDVDEQDNDTERHVRQSWPQLHHPQPHMHHAHHSGHPSSPSSPAGGSISSLATSVPKHQPDVRLQIGFNPTPDAASILSSGSGGRRRQGHSRTGSNASARSLLVVPPSRDEDSHSTLGPLPDFGTPSSTSSLASPATGTPTVAVSNVVVPWTARTVSNTLGLAIATDGLAQEAGLSSAPVSSGAPSSIQSPVSASGQPATSQQGSIRARRLSKSLLTAPLLAQKPAGDEVAEQLPDVKHPSYPIPTPPTLAHDQQHHQHHQHHHQYEFPEFQPLTLASPNSTVAPMPVPMPKAKDLAFVLPPSPRSSSITHPTSSRPAEEDQNEPMIGSAPVGFRILDSAAATASAKEEAHRRHTLDAASKKALSMSATALSTSPPSHHHRHRHTGLTDSPLMVGGDTPMDIAGPLGAPPTTPLPSSSSTSSSSQRLSHLVRRSSSTSLVLPNARRSSVQPTRATNTLPPKRASGT
ncbi:hypothetical protein BCR44DRAFT_1281221 [Catenaria anguillulae PL171]|uniref:Uncharacterized protein n=1 Tax=Catenaria anguillulae PL171 TaxID=765915 RepID=A0A1Y2HXT4_9FUNG|nr:hypothetical protein BCR44DRAFT_1281221 [Catenaria anguillulae PL171]